MSRRPTFINLFLIRLPIPAISSISHRISGIINFFVGVPTFVFLFLSGYLIDNGRWNASLFNFEVKFLISISLIALIYHIFAGLRHMLIDFSEYGHELAEARFSALIVFLLTAIFSFFAVMEVW